jgi:putative ABC transport system permease protein
VALGATLRDVFQLIVGRGAVLTGIALVLGVTGALVTARLFASLLHGVGTHDVAVLGGVSLLVAAGALPACLIPAWRAARVDPLICLKSE